MAVISVVYADEEYTHKFDDIDVDQILHNDRLLKRYTDCLLDKLKTRCPAEAIELKSEYRACDFYSIIFCNYKCSLGRKRLPTN